MRSADPIESLAARVRRHAPARYPVQHATAQFHLGQALADAGRLDEAAEALRASAEVFARAGLAVEGAKATNQLGAVVRLAGDPRGAIPLLRAAADAFAGAGATTGEGAARFNLGMALREAGEAGAADAFSCAADRLQAAGALEHASAAAREAGIEHWTGGDATAAVMKLEGAIEYASVAGATAAEGAAANVLGLVLLGERRAEEAVAVLVNAVAAHPLGVRPADFAMVQANLALAHEQAGDLLRARVAARQALAAEAAPEPVLEQARAVLDRLGNPSGDLPRLLGAEPFDRWPALVRVELTRLAGVSSAQRRAEATAWIENQLARPEQGEELAATWLAALLELPPEAVNRLVGDLLDALDGCSAADAERVRGEFERGMARFHYPQMLRLRDTFARLATQRGQPEWS